MTQPTSFVYILIFIVGVGMALFVYLCMPKEEFASNVRKALGFLGVLLMALGLALLLRGATENEKRADRQTDMYARLAQAGFVKMERGKTVFLDKGLEYAITGRGGDGQDATTQGRPSPDARAKGLDNPAPTP
jgi:hypothetical protein